MAIKSAYELASKRIISSRYKRNDEEESFSLDFVNDWEYSEGGKNIDEEYDNAFVENHNLNNDNKKDIKMNDIQVQESETFHYDGRIREIYWNGQFLDYGGFARMNRVMAFGLANRNVKVKIEIAKHSKHVNDATQKQLQEMSNYDISDDAPKIYGVTVPTRVSHAGKKILYTMIETSEKVHQDYAGKLNLMDEIWVPTNYSKKILENSNVHPPVKVMPLGVDAHRYNSEAGIMDFGPSMNNFKFLSVFRWSYRKGYDILLKAYLEEFSANDDVSLLLVSRPVEYSEVVGVKKMVEDFQNIKNSINKSEDALPHVALYTKTIRESDMPKVYNSCNAFALISRGEGFGLPYCEAAASGLPVIGSYCSGQTDFLNDQNSFLVHPESYVVAQTNGDMSRMAKSCRFYEGQKFPYFGSKSIEQTKSHLRYVYEKRKEAQKKAQNLQTLIQNNYTWDMAVDRVYHRISQIIGS